MSDDSLYQDLKKAKNEKLGAPIPEQQRQESAKEAENEFLSAMQETSKEFQEAKDSLGSNGAIDLFLGKIREEDERRAREVDDLPDSQYE